MNIFGMMAGILGTISGIAIGVGDFVMGALVFPAGLFLALQADRYERYKGPPR